METFLYSIVCLPCKSCPPAGLCYAKPGHHLNTSIHPPSCTGERRRGPITTNRVANSVWRMLNSVVALMIVKRTLPKQMPGKFIGISWHGIYMDVCGRQEKRESEKQQQHPSKELHKQMNNDNKKTHTERRKRRK